MGDSDQTQRLNETFLQMFNPDDVTSWLTTSRQEFIEMMIVELWTQNVAIKGYTALINQDSTLQSLNVHINGQTLPLLFCLESISQAAKKLDRLLLTTQAYNKQFSMPDSEEKT